MLPKGRENRRHLGKSRKQESDLCDCAGSTLPLGKAIQEQFILGASVAERPEGIQSHS